MQRTACLLGLGLAAAMAGWTIQALQPTDADMALRHYGLILVDNPASGTSMQAHRHQPPHSASRQNLRSGAVSTSGSGTCAGTSRCKVIDLAAE